MDRVAAQCTSMNTVTEVTFDYKTTLEKNIRSVSREASQRVGNLRKSCRVFHDVFLFGRCFRGFVLIVD